MSKSKGAMNAQSLVGSKVNLMSNNREEDLYSGVVLEGIDELGAVISWHQRGAEHLSFVPLHQISAIAKKSREDGEEDSEPAEA